MSKRSGIMLCYPFEERRILEPKFGWSFPVLTQPKLDGERCRNDSGALLSSECNTFQCIPHINEAIREQGLSQVKLDGELYRHGWDFEQIHSVVSRTKNIHPEAYKIQYHIFDLWNVGEPEFVRRQKLMGLNLHHPLYLVQVRLAYSLSDIMTQYNSYRGQGFEGIIVRKMEAPYLQKKCNHILKFKPKKSDEYRIDEVVEATTVDANEPKGIMGAFWLTDPDGNRFKVGAGELTHDQRKWIWENREEVVGEWCKFTYQHLTSKGVPRFGLCLRENSWLP